MMDQASTDGFESSARDVTEEFLERDLLPADVEDRVETLLADGRPYDAVELILKERCLRTPDNASNGESRCTGRRDP